MVTVENLCKDYCGFKAVDGLSFEIKDGSVTGLLGPNGAGKSTTMRMLTGFLAPTSGNITVCGADVIENPMQARKFTGYLPEIPPLYPDMTVKEHLKFICELRCAPRSDIDRVCEYLNISHVSGRMIRHLSKGYRQRVGFAAALVGSPKFLVLDEPTVGLDPEQIIEIRDLIHTLSSDMSILISSHMLGEISSVCDSLVIMRRGRLMAKGSRGEIEQSVRSASRYEITADGDGALIERLLRAVSSDAAVEHISDKGNEHTFILSAAKNTDLRSAIFEVFAAHHESVKLLSLKSMDKTLEEVFLDIIRE